MFENQCLNLGLSCNCNTVIRHIDLLNNNSIFNYNEIARSCLNQYYRIYDTNVFNLSKFFSNNTKFTFQNFEFNSFYHLLFQFKNNGIKSFYHRNIKYNTQPLDKDSLLITVYGEIKTNKNWLFKAFTETFVLEKNLQNGNFYITNNLFKLI